MHPYLVFGQISRKDLIKDNNVGSRGWKPFLFFNRGSSDPALDTVIIKSMPNAALTIVKEFAPTIASEFHGVVRGRIQCQS